MDMLHLHLVVLSPGMTSSWRWNEHVVDEKQEGVFMSGLCLDEDEDDLDLHGDGCVNCNKPPVSQSEKTNVSMRQLEQIP